MIKALKIAALSGMFTLAAGVAHAACSTEIAKDDLTDAQAAELYECIEGKLLEGYNKSGKAVAGEYRNWFMPSTTPFISATHGKRFVNHYINDIGRDAYMSFNEDDLVMPVGSIAVKESYMIIKKGKVRRGPLFVMEKVAAGTFPDTDDWKYTTIIPNGKILGETGTDTAKKEKFCHDCHEAVLDGQDVMFFPDENYRSASN